MAMNYFKKLPEPEVLKAEYPMTPELQAIKTERDREIRDIFTGASDKFIVIIGPCSADREDAVIEYITRLAKVNEKTKDRLMIIPRVYTNKQHRLTASGMDIPVGMKNPTSGDFSVMINSVIAAQSAHEFIYRGYSVSTTGNDLAHIILRGGVNKHGTCIPNYHYEDLERLNEMYLAKDLKNPAAIIDANHSNSNKKYKEQMRITSEVLHSRRYNSDIKKLVKGVMIESYLEEGNQKISNDMIYGKSITDPCIGWKDTEALLYKIAEEC